MCDLMHVDIVAAKGVQNGGWTRFHNMSSLRLRQLSGNLTCRPACGCPPGWAHTEHLPPAVAGRREADHLQSPRTAREQPVRTVCSGAAGRPATGREPMMELSWTGLGQQHHAVTVITVGDLDAELDRLHAAIAASGGCRRPSPCSATQQTCPPCGSRSAPTSPA